MTEEKHEITTVLWCLNIDNCVSARRHTWPGLAGGHYSVQALLRRSDAGIPCC